MRVLILGDGTSTHVLALSLKRSAHSVFHMPNSEISLIQPICESCAPLPRGTDAEQHIVDFARKCVCDLVVVTDALLISQGLVDKLGAKGLCVFGPSKASSAAFQQRFDARLLVQSTQLECLAPSFLLESIGTGDVERAIQDFEGDCVIKPNSKDCGVPVSLMGEHHLSISSLRTHIEQVLQQGIPIVLEKRLEGEVFGIVTLTDGETVRHSAPVVVHSRLNCGEWGPICSGMGAHTIVAGHASSVVPAHAYTVACEIVSRVVAALSKRSIRYVGALCGQFMITKDGVKWISHSIGFGACEALCTITGAAGSIAEVLLACANKSLHALPVEVLHPQQPTTCIVGRNVREATVSVQSQACDGCWCVVHSGPVEAHEGGQYSVHHGAAVGWVAQHDDLNEAWSMCYSQISAYPQESLWWRPDIVQPETLNAIRIHLEYCRNQLIHKTVNIGVLASTNCTDMDAIWQAIRGGRLNAEIKVVVTNRQGAGVVRKCERLGIPIKWIPSKDRTREAFDADATAAFREFGVHLVLGIGFMRILSAKFCDEWQGRVMNVHPSLLPAFAGGMDLSVHEEVIKAGVLQSGCTVHMIEQDVDAGAMVVQKACLVLPGETSDSLKGKVQCAEGEALVRAVQLFAADRHLTHPSLPQHTAPPPPPK
eukprot:c17949_g1_i2.p1 GENE.c17949_g1_i2~~c17949_g1_i2.p1  ORF type:complete len:653 (+),score=114.41 c17949_g1_i2:31-1989(+)